MLDYKYIMKNAYLYECNKQSKYLDNIYIHYLDNINCTASDLYNLKDSIELYGCVNFFNMVYKVYNELIAELDERDNYDDDDDD